MSAEVAQVVPKEPGQSLVSRMAQRFGVEPNKMLATLKATAFKGEVSNEQMMALLIVAEQHHLNPWVREIFAFPDKNNGIVPVVSVDGWCRIINEHPQLDGIEFQDGPLDKNNMPEWIECVIHRKDRQHPIRVREHMAECKRPTGPWGSHPRRMLRHKSLIQCARVAFAFSGVYDEDEAQRIIEGEAAGGHDESPGITSINKSIKRGKATIEGEAVVESDSQSAPESAAQPPGAASSTATQAGSGAGAAGTNAGADLQIAIVDAIAELERYKDQETLSLYCDSLPSGVNESDQFAKAVAKRLSAIKAKK